MWYEIIYIAGCCEAFNIYGPKMDAHSIAFELAKVNYYATYLYLKYR